MKVLMLARPLPTIAKVAPGIKGFTLGMAVLLFVVL
jgi:hypothetical protein